MGKCIWKERLTAQRRRDVYKDFLRLAKKEKSMTVLVGKLAMKYGISLATVYSDLRKEGGFANGSKPAQRLAKQ